MRRGLTLIEVLIAIALVVALVGGMYGFLFELLDTRAQTVEIGRRHEAAMLLVDRLEQDLLGAVAASGGGAAGVSGDEHSITLLTRGVPVFAAAGAPAAALADLEQAEYRFRGDTIEARRGVVGAPGASTSFESFGATVHEVRFRYHDGGDWRESFNTLRAGRLPAAVEVSIWFEPWEEEDAAADDALDEDLDEPWMDDAMPDEIAAEMEAFDREIAAERDAMLRPPPDRRRVIVVPDAEGGEEAS